MAHRYHCAINKICTRTSSKRKKFDKEYQFEEYVLFQFYKSIILYRFRKILCHVFRNTIDVILLEITKCLEKGKKNCYYFTVRQRGFLIAIFIPIGDWKKISFQLKIKILINSSIIRKISVILSFLVIMAKFVICCFSDLKIQINSVITNF